MVRFSLASPYDCVLTVRYGTVRYGTFTYGTVSLFIRIAYIDHRDNYPRDMIPPIQTWTNRQMDKWTNGYRHTHVL